MKVIRTSRFHECPPQEVDYEEAVKHLLRFSSVKDREKVEMSLRSGDPIYTHFSIFRAAS